MATIDDDVRTERNLLHGELAMLRGLQLPRKLLHRDAGVRNERRILLGEISVLRGLHVQRQLLNGDMRHEQLVLLRGRGLLRGLLLRHERLLHVRDADLRLLRRLLLRQH